MEKMSDEDLGALMHALLKNYNGETVDTDGLSYGVSLVYPLILGQIERAANYRKTQKENGGKGGRPPKNKAETQTEPKQNPTETQPKPSVTVTVTDNSNIDILPPNPPKGGKCVSDESSLFITIWEEYPRKEGVKVAQSAFMESLKQGASPGEILAGVRRYCDYVRRNNAVLGTRFIVQGSRFFKEEMWREKWSGTLTGGTREKAKLTAGAVLLSMAENNAESEGTNDYRIASQPVISRY